MMIHAGDVIEAKITALMDHDLTPAARAILGQTFRWTAMRIISPEDSATYSGQWRMELSWQDFRRTGVWWTPLCDLSDVVIVGVDREVAELWALLHD